MSIRICFICVWSLIGGAAMNLPGSIIVFMLWESRNFLA